MSIPYHPPGRPSARKKPLRDRLYRSGITYQQVADLAKRAHVTVRFHVDGRFDSPAVRAAIEQLLTNGEP